MIKELKNNSVALLVERYLRATFAITAIVPLHFTGAIAGSEFLTYAATKLYFALDLDIGSGGTGTAVTSYVIFYNAADVAMLYASNEGICYNSGTAVLNYVADDMFLTNLWFSRLAVAGQYLNMKFTGYKITRT